MKKSTKEKALDEGLALLQQHGYHGFSFQDIADKLKLKKPSLYDHYASKEELVVAIIDDYRIRFDIWTRAIENLSSIEKIQKVFDVFYSFASDKAKVCPILALSLDLQGVTRLIQKEMKSFVDAWLVWLAAQIRVGQDLGQIRSDIESTLLATFIYSQAMGSQVQARIKKDPALTLESRDQIVTLIKNPGMLK